MLGYLGLSVSSNIRVLMSFRTLEPAEMLTDMAEIAKFDGLMIIHAEDAHTLEQTRS